jgi:DNA-binding NarL/FixJ family response regulator
VSHTQGIELPGRVALPGSGRNVYWPVFAPDDSAGTPTALKSRKVLIAEDDHLVAIEIEAALLDAGFEVTGIAASAEEAIELAKARKPDLAIMDIRLAGALDGVDAALELFRESGVRSIFATAHQDAAMRRRAGAAMPLGWIAKPYQPLFLVDAVRNAFFELDKS